MDWINVKYEPKWWKLSKCFKWTKERYKNNENIQCDRDTLINRTRHNSTQNIKNSKKQTPTPEEKNNNDNDDDKKNNKMM